MWWVTVTGYPDKLVMPHLWRCSRQAWWVPGQPDLGAGSLAHSEIQAIQWFYDSFYFLWRSARTVIINAPWSAPINNHSGNVSRHIASALLMFSPLFLLFNILISFIICRWKITMLFQDEMQLLDSIHKLFFFFQTSWENSIKSKLLYLYTAWSSPWPDEEMWIKQCRKRDV